MFDTNFLAASIGHEMTSAGHDLTIKVHEYCLDVIRVATRVILFQSVQWQAFLLRVLTDTGRQGYVK